jgi:hypothetical protein
VNPRVARLLVPATIALLTACARPVLVETDPAAAAAIEVVNQTGTTMIVEYQAGQTRATLGAVADGGTERFIITLPPGTVITVTGRNDAGTRAAGPYTLTLERGTTQRVTLR